MVPSQFLISQYVKVVQDHMCLTTMANFEQALMFINHAEAYYRDIIYPQLLTKYLTTTEEDQSASKSKEDSLSKSKRRASVSPSLMKVQAAEMNIKNQDELSPVNSSDED